jgi:hypothetical protein
MTAMIRHSDSQRACLFVFSLIGLIFRSPLLRRKRRPAAMLVDGKGSSHQKDNGTEDKQSHYLVHTPTIKLIAGSDR